MGFLDNTSITVDAILTKKGRELLARGETAFKISKFALADDEVDYNLWDTAHPNGSSYYGAVIENMPVLEAFTDETQVMRYKLITLNKTTTQMPTLNIGIGDTTMNFDTSTVVTANTTNGSDTAFSFTVSDTDIAYISADGNFSATTIATQQTQKTATVTGTQATLQPRSLRVAKSAKLTVEGNNTGAISVITLTTEKDPGFNT
jgi:hypothetical protein